MKSYCLLLAVLCSAFIIQDVNSTELKKNSAYLESTTQFAADFTPTQYSLSITPFDGIQARDVGVGADGTIWIISNTPSGNDFQVFYQKPGSTTWVKVAGQATYISVDNTGAAWVITSTHGLYRWGGSGWVQSTGVSAYEVSCSPDGNVFYVGASNALYWQNRAANGWNQITGTSGTRLAGGKSQSMWHVSSSNAIFRSIVTGWEGVPASNGVTGDIAAGLNGLYWISTSAAQPNQLSVFDELRQGWVIAPISDYLAKNPSVSFSKSDIKRVAVAPNGDVIAIKADYSMFRMRFNWGTA